MESLPPELAALILKNITDPRDAGRLRRINQWWRVCVNEFAVGLQFDPKSIVPWEHLRDFKRVECDGCIEVQDPAELDRVLNQHPCTELVLVVHPGNRTTWKPQSILQSMDRELTLRLYSGVLNHKLTPGYRVGYIRSYSHYYNESVDRLQELATSSPVYAYYRGLDAHVGYGIGMLMLLRFSHDHHSSDTIEQVFTDRLKRQSVNFIIRDRRYDIDSNHYRYFNSDKPQITNGWITHPSTSTDRTIRTEYIQEFAVTNFVVKEIETLDSLQYRRKQLIQALIPLIQALGITASHIYGVKTDSSLESCRPVSSYLKYDRFAMMPETDDAEVIHGGMIMELAYRDSFFARALHDSGNYIQTVNLRRLMVPHEYRYTVPYIVPIQTPEGSRVGIIKPMAQFITPLHSQSKPFLQTVAPAQPKSPPKSHIVSQARLHRPRWTKHDLKGHHPNTKNTKKPTHKRFRYR